jgi:DNA-binding NarL/FixJ family response regulator
MRGLLLSDDMIFTSRIAGTAKDLGHSVQTAQSADRLLDLARQETPACVIIDLANPGLNLGEMLADLAGACAVRPYVVAYGSHVDAASLRAAREAGCNLVWPRSKFVEELPRALPEWFSQSRTTG